MSPRKVVTAAVLLVLSCGNQQEPTMSPAGHYSVMQWASRGSEAYSLVLSEDGTAFLEQRVYTGRIEEPVLRIDHGTWRLQGRVVVMQLTRESGDLCGVYVAFVGSGQLDFVDVFLGECGRIDEKADALARLATDAPDRRRVTLIRRRPP